MTGKTELVCGMVAVATVVALAQAPPHRVMVGATGQWADLDSLIADLGRADVAFLGEPSDNANAHRLQLALLEGLASRRGEIVLAMEMFDRDVQEPVEHFLMGHISEGEFLSSTRPWPRYQTDYKPLVSLAIVKEWPVVAANAPRAVLDEVTSTGLSGLQTKPDAQKTLFARELRCATNADNGALARCVSDETMAESISQAYAVGARGGKRPLVVSINDASRSNTNGSLVERTRRRLPDKRFVVVAIQPVDDLDHAPADAGTLADYVVYVTR